VKISGTVQLRSRGRWTDRDQICHYLSRRGWLLHDLCGVTCMTRWIFIQMTEVSGFSDWLGCRDSYRQVEWSRL